MIEFLLIFGETNFMEVAKIHESTKFVVALQYRIMNTTSAEC